MSHTTSAIHANASANVSTQIMSESKRPTLQNVPRSTPRHPTSSIATASERKKSGGTR